MPDATAHAQRVRRLRAESEAIVVPVVVEGKGRAGSEAAASGCVTPEATPGSEGFLSATESE